MPTLYHRENTFVWQGTYEERSVPKGAGFLWSPSSKVWYTDDVDRALTLVEFAEPGTRRKIKEEISAREQKIAASRAAAASIEIPAPPGCEYLPYQKAAIAYARGKKEVLFGDEMGLGKTIEAIGTANDNPEITSILVICPASVKIVWKRELEKWLVRPRTIGIVGATGDSLDSDILIINYDIAKKWRKFLKGRQWDLIILDECHYLKNQSAQRTRAVLGDFRTDPGLRARVQRIWISGTPGKSRHLELWPMLRSTMPHRFNSFWDFVREYCGAYQGPHGWDFSGSTRGPELQRILRENLMVRRLKADVLTELPPKRRQIVTLESKTQAPLKAEQQVLDKLDRSRKKAIRELEIASSEAEYKAAVKQLRTADRVAFQDIARVRHETAVSKAHAAVSYIRDQLAAGAEKLVVFAHHRDVIDYIYKEFQSECVVVTGSSSTSMRQHAVDQFMGEERVKLFVGNIQAAGVGITLTAASTVVFVEQPWTPSDLRQAEDRVHRIGQTQPVLIQYLVLEGSIDARVAKTLVEKQGVMDRLLDDEHQEDEDSLWREIVTGSRDALLSSEQIERIHEGLMVIVPDVTDKKFVGTLVSQDKLTEYQAIVGRNILAKYKVQVGLKFLEEIGA